MEYEAVEWVVDGHRNLLIEIALGVFPYTRQTRTTRWRTDHPSGARARAYNESRATLRDTVTVIMLNQRLKPFGPVPLGMASFFWLEQPRRVDLSNLEKALEDAMNTILYPDDRWVWRRGEGGKALGKPRFRLHLWELQDDAAVSEEGRP